MQAPVEFRDILFGLTPVQFWVLSYLVFLSKKQGKSKVTLPKPGEDKLTYKKISHKRLIRTVDELNDKRELLNIIVSKSGSQKIEIYLPKWLIEIISEICDASKILVT